MVISVSNVVDYSNQLVISETTTNPDLSGSESFMTNQPILQFNLLEHIISVKYSIKKIILFQKPITVTSRKDAKSKIFELIQENPNIWTSEILEKIDYDGWELFTLLEELKNEGKVE